jgi:TetR/AcrR family transcriptional regulator, transcriptional repressor for nem operon
MGRKPKDTAPMRPQIKALARDLLIQRGYRGVSFGAIASALDTTRANIHYHFGNKHKLVEEVLDDYVEETLAGLKGAFDRADLPLTGKIAEIVEISRRRHRKYNPAGTGSAPWSLIARMRQDSDALTLKGRAALKRFSDQLNASITAAIRDARDRGEFVETMPVEDVALQLVAIANSAGPITQDAGDFDRLEQLYFGFGRIVQHAYGNPGERTKASRIGRDGARASVSPRPRSRATLR